jgi:carbon-monoxide dehydrogenase large subunit
MGMKRFEDPQLLQGVGTFVEDVQLPDMLHASVLHSPHAHARIRSVDITEAINAPGVLRVVTASDLAGTNPSLRVAPNLPDVLGPDKTTPAHPTLASDRVRYVGEPVAVVVAETRYQARDALDLIRVDYEPLPVVVDPEDALKDEVVLHEDLGTNILLRMDEPHDDLTDAFSQADRILRGSFESKRVTPAAMENRGVVATYDREADVLTVWSSTQSPHNDKAQLAYMLKRDPRTIRVIAPDVGGGFGGKNLRPDMGAVCYLAVELARPIKCIEDRSENMTFYHSRGATCDAEVAVKNDGTILGIRYHLVWDIGAYFVGSTAVSPYNMAHRMAGPYKTPLMDVHLLAVATNKPTTGPYRSAGGAEAGYFSERTMDMVAAELGISTVEVRQKNLVPEEAIPYRTPTGYVYDSGDYSKMLDDAVQLSDYQQLLKDQEDARRQGRLVGIGITTYIKSSGGDGPLRDSNSRVEIDQGGHVKVYTEASPHGQGTETTFAQVGADILGISPDQITVLHGDTDELEIGAGTAASRGVVVSGNAVYLALQQAREKMAQIGADLFGCAPDQVDFQDGGLQPAGSPGQRVSFAEAAQRAFSEETLPPGLTPGLEFTSEYTLVDAAFPYGGQIVVVEVDRDTGDVKLVRHFGVHDCGVMINPKLIIGQHHGGLAQGIGQAMSEGIEYTPDGQPLNSTFLDYGLPTAEDMPEPVLLDTETPSPTNPMQVKGAGEITTTGTAVVIVSAVLDALGPLGVRDINMPLTPARVWQAIHESNS